MRSPTFETDGELRIWLGMTRLDAVVLAAIALAGMVFFKELATSFGLGPIGGVILSVLGLALGVGAGVSCMFFRRWLVRVLPMLWYRHLADWFVQDDFYAPMRAPEALPLFVHEVDDLEKYEPLE